MPRKYSLEVRRQVIELARSGTRVKQLAVTFGVAEVTIYNWLKRDRVDRGEESGKTTEQQLELTASRKRIKQLETELAVARKINEVFLKEGISPKAVPGDRVSDRAGIQDRARLSNAGGVGVWLLRVEGQARPAPDASTDLAG